MTIKNNQILQTSLKIESKYLSKNINNIILQKLKEKYEGKCSEHGFILKDTTKLINRKLGNIVTINNSSFINYIVNYNADILYPTEGDELNIVVDRVNKMGVLGYIKFKESDDFEKSPLIIIIPNEYFTEEKRDINSITKGQKLNVKILGCRIKFGHEKIQIVAEPV